VLAHRQTSAPPMHGAPPLRRGFCAGAAGHDDAELSICSCHGIGGGGGHRGGCCATPVFFARQASLVSSSFQLCRPCHLVAARGPAGGLSRLASSASSGRREPAIAAHRGDPPSAVWCRHPWRETRFCARGAQRLRRRLGAAPPAGRQLSSCPTRRAAPLAGRPASPAVPAGRPRAAQPRQAAGRRPRRPPDQWC
jgi:hypothetical protein